MSSPTLSHPKPLSFLLLPGSYLPVVACIGGILSPQPRHYMASDHDVIHLNPKLSEMWAQQGYVACQPDAHNHGARALHFTIKVTSGSCIFDMWPHPSFCTPLPHHYFLLEQLSSLECPSPSVQVLAAPWDSSDITNRISLESFGSGTFQRAKGSVEAQILVLPTLEITNSLPYQMEVSQIWIIFIHMCFFCPSHGEGASRGFNSHHLSLPQGFILLIKKDAPPFMGPLQEDSHALSRMDSMPPHHILQRQASGTLSSQHKATPHSQPAPSASTGAAAAPVSGTVASEFPSAIPVSRDDSDLMATPFLNMALPAVPTVPVTSAVQAASMGPAEPPTQPQKSALRFTSGFKAVRESQAMSEFDDFSVSSEAATVAPQTSGTAASLPGSAVAVPSKLVASLAATRDTVAAAGSTMAASVSTAGAHVAAAPGNFISAFKKGLAGGAEARPPADDNSNDPAFTGAVNSFLKIATMLKKPTV